MGLHFCYTALMCHALCEQAHALFREGSGCPSFGVGPELEVPAYGCEDHFQELDTAEHSWECIAELLQGSYTNDILCDVGMPIIHRGDFFIISSTCPSLKPPKAMHRCNLLQVETTTCACRCAVQLPHLSAEWQGGAHQTQDLACR